MIDPPPAELYIGLMSGTSQDAIDGVLAEFPVDGQPRIRATHSAALTHDLRHQLDSLQRPGEGDLGLALQLHHDLGQRFADCALRLLDTAGFPPKPCAPSAVTGKRFATTRMDRHLTACKSAIAR